MRGVWVILAAVAVKGLLASPDYHQRNATEVCNDLKTQFWNNTFLPNEVGYTDEAQLAWSTTSWLGPDCVFAPANARQLSFAVRTLSRSRVQFAMRGGGHMPISSSNSIGSDGILVSSTNLNTLALSGSKNTLSVGSGRRWTDVYTLLDGTGLTVLGGRIGPVGVPGFLLGGGVSFHSYEYGMASTNGNIRGFECVLADGRVVEANPESEFSDLFWALQGGGNSFCLVTRFDLRTREAPYTMLGFPTYGGWEVKDKFMDSVFNFATGGHNDPKASIIPVVQFTSGKPELDYSSTLFYNGNDNSPTILQDFLGGILMPLNGSSTLSPYALGQYSQAVRPSFEKGGQAYGRKERFYVLPIIADREAMRVVHDAYFEAAQTTFATSEDVSIGLAFNPITSQLLHATNSLPGCLQGLDETPSFWIQQIYGWKKDADDARIYQFVRDFNANMTEVLGPLNVAGSYYYLNAADEGQLVFESYPTGSLDRLKTIRDKYDPERVFTDLMPGGFKVADRQLAV